MLNSHGKYTGKTEDIKSAGSGKQVIILLGLGIKNDVLSICFKTMIIVLSLALGAPVAIGLFTVLPSVAEIGIKNLLRSFNYFTFISYAMCLSYYFFDIIHLLRCKKRGEEATDLFMNFKGLVTIAAAVTMTVFALFVDKSFFTIFTGTAHGKTEGLDICLNALHYVFPIMTVTDWLLFDKKGLAHKSIPLITSVTVVVYTLHIMATSLFFGGSGINTKYLYRFYDIDKLGVGTVVFMALLVIGIVIGISCLFMYADRALAHAAETEKSR